MAATAVSGFRSLVVRGERRCLASWLVWPRLRLRGRQATGGTSLLSTGTRSVARPGRMGQLRFGRFAGRGREGYRAMAASRKPLLEFVGGMPPAASPVPALDREGWLDLNLGSLTRRRPGAREGPPTDLAHG